MERTCLECQKRVIGRADKKFCGPECRSTYNNRLNSDATNLIRRVNAVLRRNRRILKNLNPNGKVKINHNRLSQEGFNFNYYTNSYTTKAGKTYFFCYDQGYLPLGNEAYALVERQEYVS